MLRLMAVMGRGGAWGNVEKLVRGSGAKTIMAAPKPSVFDALVVKQKDRHIQRT